MTGILNLLAGAVGVVKDTYFNLVTLLLPGNGTNGAQNNTFLDSSNNTFSITRNGNATQGTFSPFSQTGWSNYFDGTDDYLSIADNAVLRPGTSNFTLEAWIWRGASGAAHTIYAKGSASTGIVFQVTSTNVLRFTHTTTNIDSAGTIAANAWTHVAVVREGTGTNQTKLYINGTQDGQGTVSTDFTQTEEVRIGTNRGATEDFNGYISNLRFVKGTALYTGTFTPSTTPLTTTSQGATATEVELLTCQDNRFLDNSGNAFTITVNGTPSVQAFSPFAPTAAYSAATNGGSGYFDGTADYLLLPSGSTSTITTNADFTFECWTYLTGYPNTYNAIFGGTTNDWTLSYNSTNGIYLAKVGSPIFCETTGTSGTWTMASMLNSWNHIAVTRSGNSWTIWINGVSRATATQSQSYTNSQKAFFGEGGNLNTGQGYLSGARYTTAALYSSTFTPPTAPPTTTVSSGTCQLLCNFTNAGITDATGKNALETVGNAQISTTQSKFGGSSMYFDGTGDYLFIPSNQNLAIGSGDFTIEFWLYANSLSNAFSVVIDTRPSAGTETNAFLIYFATNTLRFKTNGSDILSYASFPTGAWKHVAITRSGTNVRLFVDGTQSGSTATSSVNFTETSRFVIGVSYPLTSDYLNGYIDDLRITKGYARYTASFTPPTAAFATQ